MSGALSIGKGRATTVPRNDDCAQQLRGHRGWQHLRFFVTRDFSLQKPASPARCGAEANKEVAAAVE
jgi:hypothetical protein